MACRLIKEYEGQYGTFFQREAQKSADMFEQAEVVNGVPYWKASDRIPPTDLLQFWQYVGKPFDYDKTIIARDAEITQSLDEYRKAMENREYTAEEIVEMREAFGAGATVIDVITGKQIEL